MDRTSRPLDEFADRLQALKQRTGRSFVALSGKCGVSSSTLHRYCKGNVIPGSFALVERIATACGASNQEIRELHRLWAHAQVLREARLLVEVRDYVIPELNIASVSRPSQRVAGTAGRRPGRRLLSVAFRAFISSAVGEIGVGRRGIGLVQERIPDSATRRGESEANVAQQPVFVVGDPDA